ncbi:MAG: hypothetical protein SH817_00365 [Leptospira sp.]|nr:hypothetical protein [Leptospira sp.]
MQNIILLFSLSIFLFSNCKMGPGTSGRDVCKNDKPGGLFDFQSSIADRVANCNHIIGLYSNLTEMERNDAMNLILVQCAAYFNDLKNCDKESQNPWPIPSF